ncbi:MAG TPA: IS1380 family transposase, partial [Polyangiaceae bacterium]|nr:IS1380 family transposase [Polyangiaceae bacterium]
TLRVTTTGANLTSAAGLVEFGAFLREQGVDRELASRFGHLKVGRRVVYPMGAQLRLMLDLHAAGEGRPFGVEAMAHDALFVQLAGGCVPSVDILYDDLERFGDVELAHLEELMATKSLARLHRKRPRVIHLDIDTTVTVLFGSQQGALPGPNPRYQGRPSYHPILARVAEVDGICGALLRPGNTAFGEKDVPVVVRWVQRVRDAVGPDCLIRVRIDAAGDCTRLMQALEALGVVYYTKAHITQDLADAIALRTTWKSTDHDAEGKPTQQVATIMFQRDQWNAAGITPRVVAVRSSDRPNGKQVLLWNHLDFTVQCWLTNDEHASEQEVAAIYNDRAGIEPIIGELKSAWCIGKAPSSVFNANHAAFLIKLLAHNLFRAFLAKRYEPLTRWRSSWARRVIILRPGRLIRSGRRTTLVTIPVRLPTMRC